MPTWNAHRRIVLLAGVLLKMGTYAAAFQRRPLPDQLIATLPGSWPLALIGIIYGALVSLVNRT